MLGPGSALYEFLVPFHPHGWLKNESLTRYGSCIERGIQPTAVAISILDVKQPADWDSSLAINKHYCLVHYLLDGHHKVYASAKAGRPITLLSFLAQAEGVACADERDTVLASLR